MTPRFKVTGVTGYSGSQSGSLTPQTSYSVVDTAYNCREVRSFYARRGSASDYTRRTLANEAAAALNEWNDAA